MQLTLPLLVVVVGGEPPFAPTVGASWERTDEPRFGIICQLGNDDGANKGEEEDEDEEEEEEGKAAASEEKEEGMESDGRSATVEARVAADSAVRVSSSIARRVLISVLREAMVSSSRGDETFLAADPGLLWGTAAGAGGLSKASFIATNASLIWLARAS